MAYSTVPLKLPVITMKEIETLRTANHVVYIYPRKGIVVVDGFKYYKLKK